jgi:3-deoxy-manno-octulosonate cytidylyltransferase (CMP-KDO synthetase)
MEGNSNSSGLRSLVIIPARLGSTRLPRKMMLPAGGKPIIQHTYEAACRARKPANVCVATDHEEIAAAVCTFGGMAVMTDPAATCGTERVAEVAHGMPQFDIIVNVQGDEPEMPGWYIDLVIEVLHRNPARVMAPAAAPLRDRALLDNPACVKVALALAASPLEVDAPEQHAADSAASPPSAARPGKTTVRWGRALYFSRSPIPRARQWDDRLLAADPPVFYQHLGLYAYRREFLLQLAQMPPSPLEEVEKLEQLRVLEAGYDILVVVVPQPTLGIDTPEDYERFVAKLGG